MRRFILFFALIGIAGIAQAADIYLYDLLKDPTHARAWKTMLASSTAVPGWVGDEDRFVANPVQTIAIGSASYSVSVISKQHATNEGQAAILFNADGSRAWAAIQDEDKPELLLGAPSAAQKVALDKALGE